LASKACWLVAMNEAASERAGGFGD
jgi:hypothetical protein